MPKLRRLKFVKRAKLKDVDGNIIPNSIVNTDTASQNFNCVLCQKQFTSQSVLTDHFKSHATNHIDIRGRPIEQTTLLKYPRKDEVTLNLIQCEYCPEILTSISRAIQHKFRKHRHIGKNYFCEFCGKLFPIKYAMENHLTTTDCGKLSSNTKLLNKNELSVKRDISDQNHLPCRYCSVKFATQEALAFHEDCVHKFEKSLLQPIFLPPPSKKFKKNNSAEFFQVYYCYLCGVEYIMKYNLKKHLQKHHSEEERNRMPENGVVITCATCEAIFKTKVAYNAHATYHKPDDLYLSDETERGKLTIRVDQDFDIRRVPQFAEILLTSTNVQLKDNPVIDEQFVRK